MLKSLFKQPYKIVRYEVFFELALSGFPYAPIQYQLDNPYTIGQNVFMFPEEKNVRVKKIRAHFLKPPPFPDNYTIKNWVANYQLLNRTDGFIGDYPTRVQNPSSGDFVVPGATPVMYGTVNTSFPSNDFGPGILAGGLRVGSITGLGHSPSTFFSGNLVMSLSVYYQDED